MAVIFAAKSGNSKIVDLIKGHKMSATYAPIDNTCPDTCSMKADGTCYAQGGQVGMHNMRLTKQSVGMTPIQLAREEAAAIDGAFGGGPIPQDGARGGRDLRIHVSGDARTRGAARVLGKAASRWVARGGGRVYTYTHAWAHVHRSEWGPDISVFASINHPSEMAAARAQGYPPALVVAHHDDHKAKRMGRGRTKVVPCPSQTVDMACSTCGLCMDGDRLLRDNMAVAFAAHGMRTNKLLRRLAVVS